MCLAFSGKVKLHQHLKPTGPVLLAVCRLSQCYFIFCMRQFKLGLIEHWRCFYCHDLEGCVNRTLLSIGGVFTVMI